MLGGCRTLIGCGLDGSCRSDEYGDLYDVLGSPVGDPQLGLLKTTNTRSTDVTVPPKDPPGPQQFQVQVQLKKNGANYGQLSDIVRVTVNP